MIEIVQTTQPEDIEQCAQLLCISEPFTTLKFDINRCRQSMEGNIKEVYLAKHNEVIAGFVVLQIAGALRGYIQTICLKPEYRNKGIGSQLIKFSEERILKISPNVFMCVSSFNYQAQKLYYRLGFEKVGEFKDHILRGYDEYLLRKTTGPIIEFNPVE
jgi:[ribosomal protein S18]-alanine N-acetyltransferase